MEVFICVTLMIISGSISYHIGRHKEDETNFWKGWDDCLETYHVLDVDSNSKSKEQPGKTEKEELSKEATIIVQDVFGDGETSKKKTWRFENNRVRHCEGAKVINISPSVFRCAKCGKEVDALDH